MKKALLLFTLLSISLNYCNAQIIAYPATNSSRNFGSQCIDLHFTNQKIIGHQNNVSVKYYLNNSDALNEVSALDRFYEPLSNPQTIYARVDSNANNDFAISDVTLNWSTSFPPAGISPCEYSLCDIDEDGSEIVYLNNLKCAHNANILDVSFCNSSDNDIETTFYLTENDATNETNPISDNYLITGTTVIYTKLKNTVTNQSYIDGYITINLATCVQDLDNDGIPDGMEDPNNNLVNDDDTDNDGLTNREDNDDDGDGILTINEDYNNNGDPRDDDTNNNNISDYLELNVTLTANNLSVGSYNIYPNPVTEFLIIESEVPINTIKIFNHIGQTILSETNKLKINFSEFPSGLYFIKIEDINGNIGIKKILKK